MNMRTRISALNKQKAQHIWLVLVIAWACIRAIAINGFFNSYGINGWAYFLVDLGSGIPYAIFSGRAVIDFFEENWKEIRKNGALAVILFYIPDVYVFIFAKKVPATLFAGFLITITCFSVIAIMGFLRDVMKSANK